MPDDPGINSSIAQHQIPPESSQSPGGDCLFDIPFGSQDEENDLNFSHEMQNCTGVRLLTIMGQI